jgi:hypothetical protein
MLNDYVTCTRTKDSTTYKPEEGRSKAFTAPTIKVLPISRPPAPKNRSFAVATNQVQTRGGSVVATSYTGLSKRCTGIARVGLLDKDRQSHFGRATIRSLRVGYGVKG